MNRLGILSDIHGNLLALQAVVADMQSRDVDSVITLGDHLSGPLWPVETADFLMQQDWIHIRGNHERHLLEQNPAEHNASDHYAYERLSERQVHWLREMPASITIGDDMLAVHGAPGDDLCYLLETIGNGRTHLSSSREIMEKLNDTNAKVILCGHTHKQRVVTVNDTLIVNPGSVGIQAYEDDTPEYHLSEVGSPHARYAVMEKKGNQWMVELISVNYDVEQAVQQAQKNNRPDWVGALKTGFMNPV